MATYTVTAEFSITTEIEPEDLRIGFDIDFDDNSYWRSDSIMCDGGSVTYKVEANDEEDAESQATNFVYDGMEVEDGNGLTWMIESVSYEVEADEVPMDKERAKQIIETFLATMLATGRIDQETKEAFEYVLAYVSGMTT
jgi:hypothetical protein